MVVGKVCYSLSTDSFDSPAMRRGGSYWRWAKNLGNPTLFADFVSNLSS